MRAHRRLPIGLAGLGVVAIIIAAGLLLRLSAYRISSGSMEPDFPVGSVIVDSAALGLEPGRAATFTADGAVVTHVFTGYAADGSLMTRGTANAAADVWHSPVYPRDVRGRVLFAVPLTAPSFWVSPRGMVVGLAVSTVCLALIVRICIHQLFKRKAGDYPRLHNSSK